MTPNTVLAGLAVVLTASAAAAQSLPRRPLPADAQLRAGVPVVPRPAQPLPPLVVAAAPMPVEDAPPAFNSEATKAFASRIQPVLVNACAGCHARKDYAGRFKMRPTSGDFVDSEAAAANLHAAVRVITRDRPADSPILAKATAAHGGAKEPPLRSRAILPYRMLETWVHWAAAPEGAGIPDSFPAAAQPIQPVASRQPEPPGFATTQPMEPGRLPPLPKADPPPPPPSGGFAAAPGSAPRPALPNQPGDDPFDPAAFNKALPPKR